GHTLSYPEATALKCAVYGKRRDTGEAMTVTWTIEQAKRAGLVRDGSGWMKYPEDMLVARATGTIGRRLFEDVILGLYAPEEMGGEPDEADIIDAKAEAVAQPSLTQVMKAPDDPAKEVKPSATPTSGDGSGKEPSTRTSPPPSPTTPANTAPAAMAPA